jgi:predicted lactoylglutathione lyase
MLKKIKKKVTFFEKLGILGAVSDEEEDEKCLTLLTGVEVTLLSKKSLSNLLEALEAINRESLTTLQNF